MRHVSTWLQAALLPAEWDVCGVRCASLSVWHWYALTEAGNAYVCRAPADRDAAAELLLYASGGVCEGRRLYTHPFYRARRRKAVVGRLRALPWEQIDAAASEYVEACLRVPAHKGAPQTISGGKPGPAPRRACAPMAWILVECLSAGNPERIDAAWNTPFAVARCLFDARRDIRGEDDSLESPEEEARFDAYIAARAAEAKGAATE